MTRTKEKRKENSQKAWMGEIIRLLAKIWPSFAARPVLPANTFCNSSTRTWLSGPEMRRPYSPIFIARVLTLARASTCKWSGASLAGCRVGTPARWVLSISCKKQSVALGKVYAETSTRSCSAVLTRRKCLSSQRMLCKLSKICT